MKKLVKVAVMALIVVMAVISLTGCSSAERLQNRAEKHAESYLTSLLSGDAEGVAKARRQLERDYNTAVLMQKGLELVQEILESPWFWIVTVVIPLVASIGGTIYALIDAPTRGRNLLFSVAVCFLFHVYGILFYVLTNADYPKKRTQPAYRQAAVSQ